MAEYKKPLPVVNELNRAHWEGARKREFLIQRCQACGHLQFPPLPECSRCLREDLAWVRSSGKGNVYSYIVYHQAWHPGFGEEMPYAVAIIELEEGVRLINTVVGIAPEAITVDLPVEVTYEDVAEEVTIPKFRPRG
jgi:uncharacterized OB-fold protein